jgi:hypothetical protein
MRRSSFARKVYVPAPTPELKPVVGCRGVIHRVSDEVVAAPKAVILRSGAYLRYVASHPCFGCGIEGWTQAAHENMGKAMQGKVCDSRTFPLCCDRPGKMGCHTEYDTGMDYTREERRNQGAAWVERMQAKAKADGWKFGDLGITR